MKGWVGYKPPAKKLANKPEVLPEASVDDVINASRSGFGFKTYDNLPLPIQQWLSDLKTGKAN